MNCGAAEGGGPPGNATGGGPKTAWSKGREGRSGGSKDCGSLVVEKNINCIAYWSLFGFLTMYWTTEVIQ